MPLPRDNLDDRSLIASWSTDQRRRGLRPSTIAQRSGRLHLFAAWLGSSLLAATEDDIQVFLDKRGVEGRTRYHWLSFLHCFYTWALRSDLVARNPTDLIARPKLHRLLPRPIATDELAVAIDHADRRMGAWLKLAAFQGLRCAEIAGLRREDILEHRTPPVLIVSAAKGGNERLLPLHPDVWAALLPLPRSGFVFVDDVGDRLPAYRVSQDINAHLHSLGINSTAHTLRHWFASALWAKSKDLRMTQEMLGHQSPETTAIYTAFDRSGAVDALTTLSLDETAVRS